MQTVADYQQTNSCQQTNRQVGWLGLRFGSHLALNLHSLNEHL